MKILRIKFDNVIIFKEAFDIDFTAPDKVFANSGVHIIKKPVYTNHVIGIIGINTSGKSIFLRLINIALVTVLKGTPLTDGLIPSMLTNENTENSAITMEVYFTKESEVYYLNSQIGLRYDLDNKAEFYFEE